MFSVKSEQFTPSQTVQFQSTLDYDGKPTITIVLLPPDDQTFGNFTDRHLGEQVEMAICGEVIMAPIIQSVIYGGTLIVTGPENHQRISAYLVGGCP